MADADSPTISFVDTLWPVRGASRLARAALLETLGLSELA